MDGCARETCTKTHTHIHAGMPMLMYIYVCLWHISLKLEIMLFIMCFKGLREWGRKPISTVPERYDLETW